MQGRGIGITNADKEISSLPKAKYTLIVFFLFNPAGLNEKKNKTDSYGGAAVLSDASTVISPAVLLCSDRGMPPESTDRKPICRPFWVMPPRYKPASFCPTGCSTHGSIVIRFPLDRRTFGPRVLDFRPCTYRLQLVEEQFVKRAFTKLQAASRFVFNISIL